MSWQTILSQAPQFDDRNGVAYYEIECRSLLNEVRAPELPFDLSLNPYVNCEVGCTYCYARDFTHRRQGGDPGAGSFDREVYAKQNAAAVLERELSRLARAGRAGRQIALGTATDPYQPVERRRRLTRQVLEVLARRGGVCVSVTTKSDLVLRDVDLLQELNRTGHARVNVTITTPDRDLARTLEPRAPTPRNRLRAVERLAQAGVPVGVFCMPILPEISERSADLRRLVCAAKEAGAAYFTAGVLRLRPGVREPFFAWLARERPGLVHLSRRLYARGANAPDAVQERVERVVTALRRQYRLPPWLPFPEVAPPAQRQLELFPPEPQVDPRVAPPQAAPPRPPRALPVADPPPPPSLFPPSPADAA